MANRRKPLTAVDTTEAPTPEDHSTSPCAALQVAQNNIDHLQQYEEKQNGSLQRMEKKLDEFIRDFPLAIAKEMADMEARITEKVNCQNAWVYKTAIGFLISVVIALIVYVVTGG